MRTWLTLYILTYLNVIGRKSPCINFIFLFWTIANALPTYFNLIQPW